MENSGGCYCCCRPTMSSMDLDTALNELGMLSTVTESRKQYLREKRMRAKSESEKESVSLNTGTTTSSSSQEVEDVPRGYQVLKMNPKYIVGLSSSSPKMDAYHARGRSMSEPASAMTSDLGFFSRAGKYSKSCVDVERKTSRVARVKLSRIRRYQQPYNLPWWLSKSICPEETAGPVASTSTYSSSLDSAMGLKLDSELTKAEGLQFAFHRSKSLNDLNLAKLNLGSNTAEGQGDGPKGSVETQRREIENMSEHLKELHVNDDDSLMKNPPLFCNT